MRSSKKSRVATQPELKSRYQKTAPIKLRGGFVYIFFLSHREGEWYIIRAIRYPAPFYWIVKGAGLTWGDPTSGSRGTNLGRSGRSDAYNTERPVSWASGRFKRCGNPRNQI